MTTTLTITGTGCPIPDAHRAGPGALVEVEGLALQFDAGRSTVQRLAAADLWPTQLDAVFITHHHSDHLTGLQDLVLTRWVMDRESSLQPLDIVAPNGPAVRFAEEMWDVWAADLAVRSEHSKRVDQPSYEVHGFDVADGLIEVWSSGNVRVLSGPVRHEPVLPAVGFRVEGPDGVVAITGDTLVCDEVAVLARGADVLVYEAMRFDHIRALPGHRRFVLDYHADTLLIGKQAAELEIPTLVLTHLIPAPDDDAGRQLFVDDIRSGGFEGHLIVADDLDTVTLG